MSSTTPLTDSVMRTAGTRMPNAVVVNAPFARQLESELYAAQAAMQTKCDQTIRGNEAASNARITQLERQLIAASKDTEFYCDQAHKLRGELAAANAKIARLESGRERVLNSNTKVAAECEELQAKVAELRDELSNIAKANRFDKERFENDSCFADWAQSRSRHTLALTSTQWLDNKLTEAKIEALEEAAVIAQTNSDSNVDGGDYACGCCYEIRRMAADVKGK